MSGYWRFSDYSTPGDEAFVSSCEPHARATFIDLSKYSVPLELFSETAAQIRLEATTCAVDPGEDHEKVKAAYDIVVGKGANIGSFGLRAKVGRGGPLDVGLFHLEPERSKFTLELWLFREDLSVEKDRHVIAARKSHLQSNDAGPAIWTLYISGDGRLCFHFDKLAVVEVSSEIGSINMGPTTDMDVALWSHVALVLDSSESCDDSPEDAETEVSLLINGTLRRREIVATPQYTEAELRSTVLLICPDLWGWRFTELRLWSCARSAEDIENYRENYLSLASKRKRLQYRIKGGKKLFGPLSLPTIGQPGVLTEGRTGSLETDATTGGVGARPNQVRSHIKQKAVIPPSPSNARSATKQKSFAFEAFTQTTEVAIQPRSVGILSTLDVSHADIVDGKSLSRPHGSADAIVVCKGGEIVVATISADALFQTVKYKLSAESALLCPRKDVKIMALYSKKNLSIYNISNRKKLVEQPISSDLIFWKYASIDTLVLVTPKVIYNWTVNSDACPGSVSRPQRLCSWDGGKG